MPAGTLFIVATPIGNLGDLTPRALEVLRSVAAICAEDTRRSGQLLAHFGVSTPLVALHEHNEDALAQRVVDRLLAGESLALVSDAGTPLVSDPGFRLVRAARAAGVRVSPLPGACAAIAALSVAGLPSDRFAFEGFLPAKASARRDQLQRLAGEARTLVFYESSHRIAESLADMRAAFGADRACGRTRWPAPAPLRHPAPPCRAPDARRRPARAQPRSPSAARRRWVFPAVRARRACPSARCGRCRTSPRARA